MNKVVLDDSALLALINKEPGSEKVVDMLPNSIMSAVNVAEVSTVLKSIGMDMAEAASY